MLHANMKRLVLFVGAVFKEGRTRFMGSLWLDRSGLPLIGNIFRKVCYRGLSYNIIAVVIHHSLTERVVSKELRTINN